MLFITHKFHLASLADDFHSRTLITPVCNDFLLTGELSLTTQLAIWSETCHLTLFAHMCFKFLIGKSCFTEVALEQFGIQPGHHDSVNFFIEA